jgi:hypothetical protein
MAPVPPLVTRGFVKDPAGRTRTLVLLLKAYMGTAVLAGLFSGFLLVTGRAESPSPGDWFQIILTLVVSLPIMVVTLSTSVVFLMWVYLANVNARGLGAQGMSYSPGWAVGWYFVPIWNLWKPFLAMKEIWQASENPVAWSSLKTPRLLRIWWTLWISNNFLGYLTFVISFVSGVERAAGAGHSAAVASGIIGIVSNLVAIPLCLVAIRMVREIFRMQSQWAVQPVQSACALCRRPMAQSEMIILNGSWVCATCKPVMVQRMHEGG